MRKQLLGGCAGVALGIVLAACGGGGGGADSGTSAGPVGISLLAGPLGGPGRADGTGDMARFSAPLGIVRDSAGNFFVADSGNHTIRRMTPDGVVTTFAGSPGAEGWANGTGSAVRFNSPQAIAIDANDNLYVADTNNVIRKITPAGVATTLAGDPFASGSQDGTGADAYFNGPTGLAVDAAGNVFVADTFNNKIRKITPEGVVTTFAGGGLFSFPYDANGTDATFFSPTGLAFDASGNLYVAEINGAVIRKITPAADVITVAGSAFAQEHVDGNGTAARFRSPRGLAFDSAGNLFISDTFHSTIRKLTPAGDVTTVAGEPTVDGASNGSGAAAHFHYPVGLAMDADDNLYVADQTNNAIRRITPTAQVTTVAGRPQVQGYSNATGGDVRFQMPTAVAADGKGNVYVADTWNHLIRKISTEGEVATVAGIYGSSGSTDGTTATALFDFPGGIASDRNGNLYVSDSGAHTVRKITPAGVVSTLAGLAYMGGGPDIVNGSGSAARFSELRGIAVDHRGNVYVADSHAIRKITPAGVVTTLAGRYSSGTENGTGTAARFYYPDALAVDAAGNVYVAEPLGNTIRKITPAGVVTTLAGLPGSWGGFQDGSGILARFNFPKGLTVDAAGNVIVADSWNFALRKITPAGVVTTVAGTPGVEGVVTGELPGALGFMYAVTTDKRGAYYAIMEQSVLRVVLH